MKDLEELPARGALLLHSLVSEVAAVFIDLPTAELGKGVDAALKLAGEIIGFDGCLVRLFSRDRKSLRRVHTWTRERCELKAPAVLSADVLPKVFESLLGGRDFICESLAAIHPEWQKERQLFAAWGVQAGVGMPIRAGAEVNGAVEFFSTQGPHKWPRDVLIGMRLIVEIIGNALERQRQDQELRAHQAFDALVARVSRSFVGASVSSLDTVVKDALADVGETLRVERVFIYRRDPTTHWATLWFEWLAPGRASLREPFPRLNCTEQVYLPPAFYAGHASVLDVETLPQHLPVVKTVKQLNVRMLAIAPLQKAGQDFGALTLHDCTMPASETELTRQMTLLGELFASVIARVEAEVSLERAYRNLEVLKGRIERERDYLREEIRTERQIGQILGESPTMRAVLTALSAVAATEATVLIHGESGVGKELIAHAIHERSARKDGPLVKVNCASVPRQLFESEFFGHARGSFTGAYKDRAGRFELADRGTLFLDEVGDIPLDLQAKLLRVLQEGEYERVGEERTRRANVRVLSATNRDLEAEVAAGNFRSDLYYRLSTFPLEIPPLRDRENDVIMLARHFLSSYARAAGKQGLHLEKEQERMLLAYPWPGNVRELQHVIERAVIFSLGTHLRLDLALPQKGQRRGLPQPAPPAPTPSSRRSPTSHDRIQAEIKELERDNILAALEQTRWRISGLGGASELLGIKPSTLRDRMRVLGVKR